MPIRVVALLEATTVTGPAKNLIRFCRLVKASPESGLSISMAAFHRGPPGSSNALLDAARAAGVDVDVIAERARFDRSVIPRIREILETRRANVLQTHAVKSHFLARYAGLHRRYRWIAFNHGYTAEDLKMRLYIQLDRWSLLAAHRVVAVCRPFADALIRTGVNPGLIEVVPNSIEPSAPPSADRVCALKQRLAIPENARIILSIGRFSKEKGQADLLAAFAILARDRPGARLVLVGDGIDRPRLEQSVAALGLGDRVIFAGQQSDVWPFYGLADLFVLPSHSEGSPNVILEAMLAGVPIIATAVGGVPETVENESSALLTPARDPSALAAAIARVLGDPALAQTLARNAATRVAENFSPEAHYQSLLRIYRAVSPEPA